jgi:ABC-2 type transport system ATP-binding protein
MKCLAALERPYAGTCHIDGVDTQDDPRRVHELVGYLPDFFGLYEELTVEQHVIYAARARNVPNASVGEAVSSAIGLVGLTDRARTKAGQLSRGLRQRLAIAQTVVHRPKALLLDEPAAGLDPDARAGLSALINTLAGEGIALIVSSHILSELEDYSSNMLIMQDGELATGQMVNAPKSAELGRVRIALVADDPRFGDVLRAAGASIERLALAEAYVAVPHDPAAQAALLAQLVGAGLAVASFAEARKSLADVYRDATRTPAG